jgi:hypothetical protein
MGVEVDHLATAARQNSFRATAFAAHADR